MDDRSYVFTFALRCKFLTLSQDFYSASGSPENCLLTICVVSVSLWIKWYVALAHCRCGATYHSITAYLHSWCLIHFHIFLSVPTTYWNEPMKRRNTTASFCIQNIYMLTIWRKKIKRKLWDLVWANRGMRPGVRTEWTNLTGVQDYWVCALPLRLAGLCKGWENDVFSCGLGCRCLGHILNLLGSKVDSTYGRLAYAFFSKLNWLIVYRRH